MGCVLSDCEHEVLEVTSGRVTLTYNLYISQKIGIPLQKNLVADPTLSPLYEVARNILVQPDFMKRGIVDVSLGGVIGFYCDHPYAHTQEDTDDIIPYALMGIDMAIFNTFQSLGLVVKACPVLGMDDDLEYEEHITRAGTQFHGVEESTFNERYKDDVRWYHKSEWPHKKYKNVAWLNGWGSNSLPAFYGLVHGNESTIMCFHSKAAILIEVPAYDERMVRELA
ncbi:hypothetical protein BOTNAR_0218g00170 [Botryotinia narcissicola]|uniref:Prolyl 4-hydroxylase alpha subunit Fe(2+) 2OG dioxygenase domain-containing protein n=1 Tax=Botryotinia narcissicola TaxID=278944 RepID=A0A4Z1I5T9_9HELO|nr:hypothetical protein BOTNAR_0218g00170 [Botryotinia narcissicola]